MGGGNKHDVGSSSSGEGRGSGMGSGGQGGADGVAGNAVLGGGSLAGWGDTQSRRWWESHGRRIVPARGHVSSTWGGDWVLWEVNDPCLKVFRTIRNY
ncbi:hypothetical protein NL676_030932 [Syzygium grande]|nr:hypothetical protein NL676_030932 [Syzygium grande]